MKVQYNRNTGAITLLDKDAVVYKNSAMMPQVIVDVQINSGESVYVTFGSKNIITGKFEPDARFAPFALMPRVIEGGTEYYKHIPKDILAEPGSWALSLGIRTPYDDTRYKHLTSTVCEFVVNDSLAAIDFETLPETNYDEIILKLNEQEADIGGLGAAKQGKDDPSITIADGNVVNAINMLHNDKQPKTDNTLSTMSKTVVGAINELDERVSDVEEIADDALDKATSAKSTAEAIDGKATEALSTAEEALSEVIEAKGIAAGAEAAVEARYIKPEGGIPASDLTSEVRESLENADGAHTAVQSKLEISPDGVHPLITENNKIASSYIPDTLLGQLKYAGVINVVEEVLTISANANYPEIDGMTVSNFLSAHLTDPRYIGCYFVAQTALNNLVGTDYQVGDWAVFNGNLIPTFHKIDNTDTVTSVQGRTGSVVITKADVGLPNVPDGAQVNVLESVKIGSIPLAVTGKAVTLPAAVPTGTGQTDGLMTHEDKAKLDKYPAPESGSAGKVVSVKSDESGYELREPASGGGAGWTLTIKEGF